MRSIRRNASSHSMLLPLLWFSIAVMLLVAGLAATLYFYLGTPRDPIVPQERHLANMAPGYFVFDLETTGAVSSLLFSPDGKYLVSGTKESGNGMRETWTGDLKVWNAITGDEVHSLRCSQWIHTLSFTPDSKYLAVACSSWNLNRPGFMGFVEKKGEVRIYEFPSMKVWKILEFDLLVESARFSPDGESLAVAVDTHPKRMGPSELQLFSFPELETTWVFKEKIFQTVFTFTSDSAKIMFSGHRPRVEGDPILKTFDRKTGQELANNLPHGLSGHRMVSLEGDLLLHIHAGIYFTDTRTGQSRPDLRRQLAPRNAFDTNLEWAAMSSDQRYLLAVEAHHVHHRFVTSKVLLEDYQTGELTEVFKDPDNDVKFQRCALSPDATRFAVGTGQYVGIRGKHDDPRRGHVLLFEKKAGPQ